MTLANQIREPARKIARQIISPGVRIAAQISAKRKADDDDAQAAGCAVPRPTKPPSDKASAKVEVPA